jgi:hypothetical protein
LAAASSWTTWSALGGVQSTISAIAALRGFTLPSAGLLDHTGFDVREWPARRSCAPPLPPEAGVVGLGSGKLVEGDASIALQRVNEVCMENPTAESENVSG